MILAHGILAVAAFLFLIPAAVFTARFYAGRPGFAVRYHARIQIFAAMLVVIVFVLGNLAVGPKRALSNPHHGIGVAILVLVLLQLVGGYAVRKIRKINSLPITLHQWLGRATALLGIVQIPLGLTLYGSPKFTFILYAVWMGFLVLFYFILNFRAGSRRSLIIKDIPQSEAGQTRVTDSEYFASSHPDEHNKWKWLGPLAAGAGIWALMRGRKKDKEKDNRSSRSRSPSPSWVSGSRGPSDMRSRGPGTSYFTEEEKYSDAPGKKSGGGFMKSLGAAAAIIGTGKLFSGWGKKRGNNHDEEYSAVSTNTPRRNRPGRSVATETDLGTEYTDYTDDYTRTSLLPPGESTAMAGARSAADSRLGSQRPSAPAPSRARGPGRRRSFEDSEYSSYVSPSRRAPLSEPRASEGGGLGKGLLGALGLGWLGRKMADRKAKKEEEKLRDEEDMRSGISGSHVTGDTWASSAPPSSAPRRGPVRRNTGWAPTMTETEMTESSIEERPTTGYTAGPNGGRAPAPAPGGGHSRPRSKSNAKAHSRSRSRSRSHTAPVSMPSMPSEPSDMDDSYLSSEPPQRRDSSRRRRDGDIAAAEAAARARSVAAETEVGRDRGASPYSIKLKMHDDKDRNVTLRKLTEEEARQSRGSRSRSRANSASSMSELGSSRYGRGRYRRNSSQKRAEPSAERRVEDEDDDDDDDEDSVATMHAPNPAFAKDKRAGKDSGYYSGTVQGGPYSTYQQPGPSGGPAADATMTSLAESHGTWSEMSQSVADSKAAPPGSAAASNRRRRRLERRRASSSRPSQVTEYE